MSGLDLNSKNYKDHLVNQNKGIDLKIASIDIGTNTLLMTIAEIKNGKVVVLEDFHRIARLGFKVDDTKLISEEALDRAKVILYDYKVIINQYKVDKVSIIGTSALRDAANKLYIIEELSKVIGYTIDIIDGDTEAKLSFIGTIESDNECLVLDIGGGSTEIIYGKNKDIIFRQSINIGAVRITERFFANLPPSQFEIEQATKFIQDELKKVKELITNENDNFIDKINNGLVECYAVAGTATTMASISSGIYEFDFDKIHNINVNLIKLEEVTKNVLNLDRFTLENEFKVLDKRSDILQGGAIILLEFLKVFGLKNYICSCKGLRYGPIIQYSMDINKI